MKIFDFFKRHKSSRAEAGEDVFRKKFQSFKNLLDANNATLEIMSRLEAVSEGDFVFDRQYLRSSTDSVLRGVKEIIEELNILGNNRFQELTPVYEGIKTKIHHELANELPLERGPLVLPLGRVDRRLLLQVGGKNANLGEIKNRLRLPTPEGFVLTAEAYRLVLAENHLTQRLATLVQEVDTDNLAHLTEQSRLMQDLILGAEIPASLAEKVEQQYHRLAADLGYQPHLALRSSGLYEDQEYSFAGQFLTRLNIPFPQFFPNYLEVLASQFAPRALVYLAKKGLARRAMAMSVGCLAMVPARASGVLFTEDPTGSREDVMVIDAAWGLGPTIVEGTLTPDHYVLSKKPALALLDQHISAKPFRMTAPLTEAGLQKELLPASEQAQPALTGEALLLLGRYALQLEEYFGAPQDVEFAVDNHGQLVLLQARPLTTVPPPPQVTLPSPVSAQHPLLIEGGTVACFGVAAGPVFVVKSEEDLARFPEGAILVARHTSARFGVILHKARGMLVDIGSATSHLAILAREFKVPALVDTEKATQVLQTGQEITVDADHMRVYQGQVQELLQAQVDKPSLLTQTPIYDTLRRILRWVTPLNLTDPKLSDFTPVSCQTLHDITRFAHQMAVAEMFDLGEKAREGEVHMVRLKTNIPLNLYIIDLGGGVRADRRAKFIAPEAITSIPMQALWRGISHPEVSWAGPIPIDVKGLYSVVSRSLTAAAPQHADFWLRTLAIVSQNYLNYSSRLGYHFATVDAFVSETRNDNYLSFRFKGGAADEHRRGLRVRFLGAILAKLDFDIEIAGDLVVAKLWKYPRNLMEEKLDLVGRLMACARQRDMVMGDEKTVDWYVQAFLEGNYRFSGEPQPSPGTSNNNERSSLQ